MQVFWLYFNVVAFYMLFSRLRLKHKDLFSDCRFLYKFLFFFFLSFIYSTEVEFILWNGWINTIFSRKTKRKRKQKCWGFVIRENDVEKDFCKKPEKTNWLNNINININIISICLHCERKNKNLLFPLILNKFNNKYMQFVCGLHMI